MFQKSVGPAEATDKIKRPSLLTFSQSHISFHDYVCFTTVALDQ